MDDRTGVIVATIVCGWLIMLVSRGTVTKWASFMGLAK